jgi:hypothetical protein
MKEIFIGSSTEGSEQAKRIYEILSGVVGVKPRMWTDSFHVGDITFTAIEAVAAKVAGAVFLATPDDDSMIKDNKVKMPRANVLFEYGYLTAMLRRNRVALCRYDDVELPSDFEGLTHIPMGKFERSKDIESNASKKLTTWASELYSIHANSPPTCHLHGYSGFWRREMHFQKWMGLEIRKPDYVLFDGEVILHIPLDREGGEGSCFGNLRIKIGECYAEFNISDRLSDVEIRPDGSMKFHNSVQSRQLIRLEGTPPQKEGFEPELHAVREGTTEIYCKPDESKSLDGVYREELGPDTSSEATEKFSRRVR